MKKQNKILVILILCILIYLNNFAQLNPPYKDFGKIKIILDKIHILYSESLNLIKNRSLRELIIKFAQNLNILNMRISNVLKKGYYDSENNRDNLFADLFEYLKNTHLLIQDYPIYLFKNINNLIIDISELIDSIGPINAEPIIFAVEPYRLIPENRNLEVTFFGYFGKIDEPIVFLNDRKLKFEKIKNGKLTFTLPKEIELKEKSNLEGIFYLKKNKKDFKNNFKLYIENRNPIFFEIERIFLNPQVWVFHEFSYKDTSPVYIGTRNEPWVQEFSAKDIIEQAFGWGVDKLDSVYLVYLNAIDLDVNTKIKIIEISPESVKIQFNAPPIDGRSFVQLKLNVGFHQKKTYVGVSAYPLYKTYEKESFQIEWSSTQKVNLSKEWIGFNIESQFEDFLEVYKFPVRKISRLDSIVDCYYWKARIENDQIIITTK